MKCVNCKLNTDCMEIIMINEPYELKRGTHIILKCKASGNIINEFYRCKTYKFNFTKEDLNMWLKHDNPLISIPPLERLQADIPIDKEIEAVEKGVYLS